MKLQTDVKEITRSNDFEGREFQCDISVMSILRNNIYTDKILASIRELACNAYDAHIEAGIPDKPIQIFLPSVFEPTFKVRDYGKSMDHELVKSLYSYYGKSSKRDSNKAVGAFGIGKVAPLSYTSAFQLCCIQNQQKRIYTIYINESGVDQIDLLIECPTDEVDGTEVSFGVNPQDLNTFRVRCEQLFKFWPVYPEILNCSNYNKPEIKYSLDGMKNSAVGLVAVYKDANGEFFLKDRATWQEVENCALKEVFRDGKLLIDQTLADIRVLMNEEVYRAVK